jgi:GTP-binding protein HflX
MLNTVLVFLGRSVDKLTETISLAKTLDYKVLGKFVQKKRPRTKYLIGKGKLEELKEFTDKNEIELVIFENLLTSSQVLALEDFLKLPVIDRFDLILNVFEKRAGSKEAKLQIELARLKRKLPYIKALLGREVKKEHPGFGSSGELIIRNTLTGLRRRVRAIERHLEKFEARALASTKKRRELGKIISLAGYTNVGKTTLFNTLTSLSQPAKDEPFTTLSTKTSKLSKVLNEKVFINDTIGFISDLPHELIYAFRATLSTINNSDLILLLLDVSEPLAEFDKKKTVCEQTLLELGARNIPIIYVLNKVDKIGKYELEEKKKLFSNANVVKVSALYKSGISELQNLIRNLLYT